MIMYNEQRSVCFSLLQEVDIVREHMSRLTHMSIWVNLEQTQREDLFIGNKVLSTMTIKVCYMELLVVVFIDTIIVNNLYCSLEGVKHPKSYCLSSIQELLGKSCFLFFCAFYLDISEIVLDDIHYCERFIELMIDLEALLPTRYMMALLISNANRSGSSMLFYMHLNLSHIAGSLFCQLVSMLKFYARFEIDDITGQQLTHKEVTDKHYEHVVQLQKAAFKYFNDISSIHCVFAYLLSAVLTSGKVCRISTFLMLYLKYYINFQCRWDILICILLVYYKVFDV
uniref:Aquarius_N domain-containing protein n=1 Tax=Heterorhabditis bacteriophora TaxID=37862 RepID=A0A1I7W9A0_HETBA